jgi:exodeoxyribonuclease V alpha subunit
MTTLEHDDVHDRRFAVAATGLLREFNRAGVLEAADVHVAMRLGRLLGEEDESVLLAAGLAVRALRAGSVRVDLSTVREDLGEEHVDLGWPGHAGDGSPQAWADRAAESVLCGAVPALRVEGTTVYLDRYWREEEQVCADLRHRAGRTPPEVDEAALAAGLGRVFGGEQYAEQRAAAEIACRQWTTVLTGGPGTGKTSTVAALLALLAEQAELAGRRRPRMALAAPTGKAAARLQEAVLAEVRDRLGEEDAARLSGLQASTLHRLLGSRPDTSSRFRHDRDNRLPHDVVVVDETSMVSLTMMARLLEALRPSTRLLLVGDADQLASVDAGAVLADLVEGLSGDDGSRVAALRTSHRFGPEIRDFSAAVRDGEGDAAMTLLGDAGRDGPVSWVDVDRPVDELRPLLVGAALDIRGHAERGDAEAALVALERHRLLCAHREGPHGVRHWNRLVEQWLAEETGDPVWGTWYVGRPVLVTANDYGLGIYNGDVGVAVQADDGLRAVVAGADGLVDLAPGRLGDVETMHAMTIHKAQGSQAREVTVLLPGEESRLLTRELFYTAVTRAQERVRVVGPEGAVRAALARRARRASGLAARLTTMR